MLPNLVGTWIWMFNSGNNHIIKTLVNKLCFFNLFDQMLRTNQIGINNLILTDQIVMFTQSCLMMKLSNLSSPGFYIITSKMFCSAFE